MSAKPKRGSNRSRRKARESKYSWLAKPSIWRDLNERGLEKQRRESKQQQQGEVQT